MRPTIISRSLFPNFRLTLDRNEFTQVYNNTIIDIGGKTFMFYRHAAGPKTTNTFIAYVELDNTGFISTTPKKLDIPLPGLDIHTIDDPRAFMWKGKIALSCVFCHLKDGWWSGAIGIVTIDPTTFQCSKPLFPQLGSNRNRVSFPTLETKCAIEKNWTLFSRGDDLFVLYSIDPLIVTMWNPTLETFIEVWHGTDHGKHVSGSTPLIQTGEGEFFGMWHTHSPVGETEFYKAGFWRLDFNKMTAYVDYDAPLLGNGNLYNNRQQDLSKFYYHKSNVVFPCGIVDRGDSWWISSGWNDCRCELITVKK